MAQHHILSINNDALMLNRERVADLEAAVGSAVVSLCGGKPVVNMSGRKPVIVKSRDVLNCGNAVRWVDDVHYGETRLFAWSQAMLKPLHELSLEELTQASEMVAAALHDKRSSV